MTPHGAFLEAAAVAVDLLGTPQVAARWADPSALPHMTVGALAQHLGSQVVSAHTAAASRNAPCGVIGLRPRRRARPW